MKREKTHNKAIINSFTRTGKITGFLAVFLFASWLQIFASDTNLLEPQQQQTVTGKIVDRSGTPLPGATIVVKGSTTGVITDADGNYSLPRVSENATLVFSFVGMVTQEIAVSGRTTIDITMEEETIGLQEVVAVGYGTQKRVNVVGSVTTVSGEKIDAIPASNVATAISGRMPGTTVIQSSGEPGNDDPRILVRGRTTLGGNTGPLVVIDGIPGRSMSDIDPVDIESISVLKDASAAIYGTQAANGVFLITTKKGKDGKARLNYQFYQGFMTPTVLPKVLNSGDYATMLTEYQVYEGMPRSFTDRDIELFYNGRDPWEHPNSDWVGDLVSKWTNATKHNITLDGGNNGMYYYVSLGYRNEKAIYKQESTKYEQYNLRAKLDLPITDYLKTSVDYAGFIDNEFYPTQGAGAIYGQSTRLLPTQWSFWPSGEPGPDIEYGNNPVVTSTLQGGYDDSKLYKNELNFRLSFTPKKVKGLSIDAVYTYDIYNHYRKQFQKPWILYFPNWESAVRNDEGFITQMELVPTPRGFTAPELYEDYDRFIRKLTNVSFNYSREFGDHSVSLFGAYEQLEQNTNKFGASRKYYISDLIQTIDAGSNTDKDNSGGMSIYARKSWIGRLNYSYMDKYLMELLFRRDGSLKFPPNSRWGNFPAVLLGWRASEENFWKEYLSGINYLKLRATYGKMGMDPGNSFQYMNKYVISEGVSMGEKKDVEVVVKQSGVANPFITWEKQSTYNAGFDSKFLNDMFHLNADVFYNKRTDILTPRNASVPDFTGLQLPDENIAVVDNRGFEVDAGFHKKINDFSLNLSGNISWNRNKVIYMDEPERKVPWQERTGHPFGATLLYNAIGIFADEQAVADYPHWKGAKPGDVIFEDVNGDSIINSDDQILLDGTNAPEIFYGVSLDLQYKNWSLSLLAQGQGDYYRQNFQDNRRGEGGNYFQWNFDNRWTTENRHTNVARPFDRANQYWGFGVNNSTYWYSNMAYFRLKNAVLNYKVPKKLYQHLGVSSINVYLSGNNLFLIYAAQRNFDPEIGQPMNYPAVKTFAFGAKIIF